MAKIADPNTTSSTPYFVRARLLAVRLKENAKVMGEAADMLESFADILEMGAKEKRKTKGKAVAVDGENKEKATSKDNGSKESEKPVGGNDRVWY